MTRFPPSPVAVSIPVGFFQALQPSRRGRGCSRPGCFNPCRVFSGLATSSSGACSIRCWSFQSLSGFFRPCNSIWAGGSASSCTPFQSLSGFFRPCNGMGPGRWSAPNASFNPCRVFSGLATSRKKTTRLLTIGFQSLSGFFRPCNPI